MDHLTVLTTNTVPVVDSLAVADGNTGNVVFATNVATFYGFNGLVWVPFEIGPTGGSTSHYWHYLPDSISSNTLCPDPGATGAGTSMLLFPLPVQTPGDPGKYVLVDSTGAFRAGQVDTQWGTRGVASVAVGLNTTATGNYSLSAGVSGMAIGAFAVITGGINNIANANTLVANGQQNIAEGAYSAIGSGFGNTCNGQFNLIANGQFNSSQNNFGLDLAGTNNIIQGQYATALASNAGIQSGDYSLLGTGTINTADNTSAVVLSGQYNYNSGYQSTLITGNHSNIFGFNSFIGTGSGNTSFFDGQFIGVGVNCGITGQYSEILNGVNCSIIGQGSGIMYGLGATSVGDDCFMGIGINCTIEGAFATLGVGVGCTLGFLSFIGTGSTCVGQTASVILAAVNSNSTNFSVVAGASCIADVNSVALALNNTALTNSVALGGHDNYANEYSVALASQNGNAFQYSLVAGSGNSANVYSACFGQTNQGSTYSVTLGCGESVLFNFATAVGHGHTIDGVLNSVLSGVGTRMGGTGNLSLGSTNVITGINSLTRGSGCTVSSQYSATIGPTITNTGNKSMAMNMHSTSMTQSIANSFQARVPGGMYLYTAADLLSGVILAPNAAAWASACSRDFKEKLTLVDLNGILDALEQLIIYKFYYIHDPEQAMHMGPIAEQWNELFPTNGKSPNLIDTMDMDGIAIAACQALEILTA